MEILSPVVGPAPVSARPLEEEPQQSSLCLWGVSCSVGGWASGPPVAGGAEEQPCVLEMCPTSWHEVQKQVLRTEELCLNRILICNYGTSYLMTTNSPVRSSLQTFHPKKVKDLERICSSSVFPVLKNTRIMYFYFGAWQEEQERKETPKGGPRPAAAGAHF